MHFKFYSFLFHSLSYQQLLFRRDEWMARRRRALFQYKWAEGKMNEATLCKRLRRIDKKIAVLNEKIAEASNIRQVVSLLDSRVAPPILMQPAK